MGSRWRPHGCPQIFEKRRSNQGLTCRWHRHRRPSSLKVSHTPGVMGDAAPTPCGRQSRQRRGDGDSKRKAGIVEPHCTRPAETPIMGNGREDSAEESTVMGRSIAHNASAARGLIHSSHLILRSRAQRGPPGRSSG